LVDMPDLWAMFPDKDLQDTAYAMDKNWIICEG